MINKICDCLTNKIRKEMPEVDDERAEIISYGIQLIIGEIPKIFLLLFMGIILGLWWQTLLAFVLLLPYKVCTGGFHLKTHIGCILCTNIIYCGNAFLSTIFTFQNEMIKYMTIFLIYILGIIFISIYAPADTENVPILTKRERTTKRTLSYILLTINMIVAIFIPNAIISNILIFGTIIQTLTITKTAYKLTKNKYGYKVYKEQNNQISI